MNMGTGGGSVATNTAFGASALAANTTGSLSVAIGSSALAANTTSDANTAVGYQAASTQTTGALYTTAFGYQSLKANTSGAQNNALGFQSLTANTTGANNSGFGTYALAGNTTGGSNTALGNEALRSNTTASNNTAVGYQAGYSATTSGENTAIGYQALYTNSTSGDNVAVGRNALRLSTAAGNTAIGEGGGSAITTGAKNTIIGRYTGNQGGLDIRTANNYIVLSDGDGNPRAYWNGNDLTTAGYISNKGLQTIANSSGTLGRLGYITTNSAFQVSFDSSTAGVQLGSGATSWATFSDERLKNVTGTYTNALSDIAQIRPVKFTWKKDSENKPQVGVIAQSVQAVVPEAVDSATAEMDGDTEYLQVRYTELIPLLVAAIQEQQALITALTTRITALEAQVGA
jgi:hypothetical protein